MRPLPRLPRAVTGCRDCGAPLSPDEIGLHRKLINRGDTEYLCKRCLAKFFRVSEDFLDGKIAQFRAQGCTLFLPAEDAGKAARPDK